MDPKCLQEGLYEGLAELGFGELGDLLGGLLLLSFIGAVAVSPIVLFLYQRRVEKLMTTRGGASSGAPGEGPSGPPAPGSESQQEVPDSPETLLAALREGSRAQHRMIFLSTVVFAALAGSILTISTMIAEAGDYRSLLHWLDSAFFSFALATGLCAPLVLLGVQNRKLKIAFWIFFASLLVAAAIWDIGLDDTLSGQEKVADLGCAALLIAILYVVVAGRRLRNVVPVLTLFNLMVFVLFFAFGLVTYAFDACDSELLAVIGLVFLVLCGWACFKAAFALMGWLSAAYERQAFSETQLQLVLWTTIAVFLLILQTGTATDTATSKVLWAAAVLIALLISLAVYRWYLRRLTPWRRPRPLLLLRVFSRSRRTQRLLDDVSYRWSFIGPIYLVGGPDLAKAYLEPHELLSFLRGRARELFVLDRENLRARLGHLEDAPDPDSRYRANEFFCLADVWQEAVDALVDLSPVVLLDLRGFDAARRGTAFEVALLARKGALDRTTFLIDEDTDPRAVAQALADVPGAEIPGDRVLRVETATTGAEVLRAVLRAGPGLALEGEGTAGSWP